MWYLLLIYPILVFTWFAYLAIMNMLPYRKKMHPVAKFHFYLLAIIFVPLDVALNWILGTIIFFEIPREFMLTTRLSRIKKEHTYRAKIAHWVCEHLLNQFDPRGKHC